jgi:NTP pyrophosphatase (non-canonical NTP hydrolase)
MSGGGKMDIQAFQAQVRDLSQTFGDNTPERRIMYLVTELGEATKEALFLLQTQANSQSADVELIKERLGMEIYDVIWNAVDLANIFDIDLEQAFAKKIELNKSRKW